MSPIQAEAHPFRDSDGRPVKWWDIEIRFGRRLTRREQRRLRLRAGELVSVIGQDGVAPQMLMEKWPDAATSARIQHVVAGLPDPKVWIAHFGQTCGCGCYAGPSNATCCEPDVRRGYALETP